MRTDNRDQTEVEEVEYERHRPHLRPAPARYGVPEGIQQVDPPMGRCPICWDEVDLNLAGRVKSHMFMLHPCSGAGSLPRDGAGTHLDKPQVAKHLLWWNLPTCQECGAYLQDLDGNPRWDVTPAITFVCLGGCRRSGAVNATVQSLIRERTIR